MDQMTVSADLRCVAAEMADDAQRVYTAEQLSARIIRLADHLTALVERVAEQEQDRASWRRVAEGLRRDLTEAEAALRAAQEVRDAFDTLRHREDALDLLQVFESAISSRIPPLEEVITKARKARDAEARFTALSTVVEAFLIAWGSLEGQLTLHDHIVAMRQALAADQTGANQL